MQVSFVDVAAVVVVVEAETVVETDVLVLEPMDVVLEIEADVVVELTGREFFNWNRLSLFPEPQSCLLLPGQANEQSVDAANTLPAPRVWPQ